VADESKKKHHQVDPVFKQVVVNEFSGYQAGIQTEVEVSRLPRTIDVLITVVRKQSYKEYGQKRPFFTSCVIIK